MAEKWADYVITAVRFNVAGTHIDSVQTREDDGTSISDPPTTKSRASVVNLLENGYTFCTATASDGKWEKGSMVKIVTIDHQKYIKTNPDNRRRDNLDNLPTF
jgi:hypothetical protein